MDYLGLHASADQRPQLNAGPSHTAGVWPEPQRLPPRRVIIVDRLSEDYMQVNFTIASPGVAEWWYDANDHSIALEPGHYEWFTTIFPLSVTWQPLVAVSGPAYGPTKCTITLSLLDSAGSAIATATMSGTLQNATINFPTNGYPFVFSNAAYDGGKPAATFNGIRLTAQDALGNSLPQPSGTILILNRHKPVIVRAYK